MIKLGLSAISWFVICAAFAFGSLLDTRRAQGQWEEQDVPAPRAFVPAGAASGSQYAGMEWDPLRFGSSRRRFGSALPVMSPADGLQEGEVIYEGEPSFIGAEGEEVPMPPGEGGEIIYEGGTDEFHVGGDCVECGSSSCSSCSTGADCASCGSWGGCGRADCDHCVSLCLPRFAHLSIFGGVQGFKGPRDGGMNGNFGFHEGVNVSGRAPFFGRRGVGYQLGYRTTQTRLHGDLNSQEGRVQHFITGGLFRRSQVGLQYGVVYDFLQDDLTEELDFSQLRAEMSVLGPRGGEIGFLGMFHLNDEMATNVNGQPVVVEPVDQYLLFIRTRFENFAEGRLWGGFSDEDDGILGGEIFVPLDNRWSLAGGFTYLIPENDTPPQGTIQEAWNIGISLQWHWHGDARSSLGSPFRPLFSVADNGMMIIDQP